MLKERIITAAILIPAVVGGVLYLPLLGFAIVSAMVLILAAWEGSRLLALKKGSNAKDVIVGLLILLACWQSLIVMRASTNGPFYVLFLLIIVWTVDSAAYFIGRAFGKHKLASKISPNKTIEGAIGGVVAAMLLGFLMVWFVPYLVLLRHRYTGTVALIFLTAVVAIVGDLFESKLKRAAGVKDSGSLVRGHGGVLDRIDSLIAAAPVFTLGLFFLV